MSKSTYCGKCGTLTSKCGDRICYTCAACNGSSCGNCSWTCATCQSRVCSLCVSNDPAWICKPCFKFGLSSHFATPETALVHSQSEVAASEESLVAEVTGTASMVEGIYVHPCQLCDAAGFPTCVGAMHIPDNLSAEERIELGSRFLRYLTGAELTNWYMAQLRRIQDNEPFHWPFTRALKDSVPVLPPAVPMSVSPSPPTGPGISSDPFPLPSPQVVSPSESLVHTPAPKRSKNADAECVPEEVARVAPAVCSECDKILPYHKSESSTHPFAVLVRTCPRCDELLCDSTDCFNTHILGHDLNDSSEALVDSAFATNWHAPDAPDALDWEYCTCLPHVEGQPKPDICEYCLAIEDEATASPFISTFTIACRDHCFYCEHRCGYRSRGHNFHLCNRPACLDIHNAVPPAQNSATPEPYVPAVSFDLSPTQPMVPFATQTVDNTDMSQQPTGVPLGTEGHSSMSCSPAAESFFGDMSSVNDPLLPPPTAPSSWSPRRGRYHGPRTGGHGSRTTFATSQPTPGTRPSTASGSNTTPGGSVEK